MTKLTPGLQWMCEAMNRQKWKLGEAPNGLNPHWKKKDVGIVSDKRYVMIFPEDGLGEIKCLRGQGR